MVLLYVFQCFVEGYFLYLAHEYYSDDNVCNYSQRGYLSVDVRWDNERHIARVLREHHFENILQYSAYGRDSQQQ